MSPELLSGQPYSYPSDIWSLGIMLYELMTFDVPFKGALMQFAQMVNSENIPQITQHYSSGLKQLASNMLIKDPLQRISASDILNSSLIQSITSAIPSNIEGIKTAEEYFNLGKQALITKKFHKAEKFLILAIKGGFIRAVNEY
jgi:serine/threonine protein kinase